MGFLDRVLHRAETRRLPGGAAPPPGTGLGAPLRRAGIVLLHAAVILLAAWDFGDAPAMPRLHEVAPFDVKSSTDFDLIDREQTEAVKREAEKMIPLVHRYRADVYDAIIEASRRVTEVARRFARGKGVPAADPAEVRKALLDAKIPSFDPEASLEDLTQRVCDASAAPPDAVVAAGRYAEELFRETLSDRRERSPGMSHPGVKSEDMAEVKDTAYRKIRRTELAPELKELVGRVFFHFARPTYVVDTEEMEKRRVKTRERIQPVRRRISKGEVIVRSGEIVKAEHVEVFERLNLNRTSRRPAGGLFGGALIGGVAVALLFGYVAYFRPEGRGRFRDLAFAGIVLAIAVGLAKGVRFLLLTDAQITVLGASIPFFSPFVMPAVLAPVLIALFVDAPLALFANGTLAVLLHIALRAKSLDFFLAVLLSGALAVMSIRKVNHRGDLTRAGALASFGNVAVIAGMAFMEGNPLNPQFSAWLVRDLGWGFLNGFLSAVIALGLLPYLETAFKTSTPMRLLELADLNLPLLRRLSSEAQGTFHHSIAVGTLAESAAERIGADALLCRVGSYYHDIGKLKRPHFFVENQAAGDNVHDSIKPNLSALAIMAHCRDGVEIARGGRLTREILDIVEQHHGTNLLTYFYVKSQTGGAGDDLGRREVFRYPGPKPQTREAAIVLLADAVEAATRSVERPTASSLKGMIKKIIQSRFLDGQFDECTLTLRDLSRVQQAFTKTILGMYHKRIEYPDQRKRPVPRREARPKRERPAEDPARAEERKVEERKAEARREGAAPAAEGTGTEA